MASQSNNNGRNHLSASKSSGVGFLSLLTLLFIALKLMGHIDWSWVMVLSPMWIPFVAFFSVLFVSVGFMAFIAFVSFHMAKWRHRK